MANNARQLGWALIGCGDAGRAHLRGAMRNTEEIGDSGVVDTVAATLRFAE